MNNQHFRSLDTLRGIAALAVCLYHSHAIFGLDLLVPHAYLAVDLFFILSGFILVQRYAPEIESNSKITSLGDFAIVRLARLYPLYLLVSIIGALYFAAWLFINGQLFVNFKNYIFAIINSIVAIPYLAKPFDEVGAIFPFATQAWSIFWEIIVSLAFYFHIKYKNNYAFLISIIGFCILIIQTYTNNTIDGGWQAQNFFIGGLRAFTGFFMGIFTAEIYAQIKKNNQKSKINIFEFFAFVFLTITLAYCIFSKQTHFTTEACLIFVGFPTIVIGAANSNALILNNRIGDFLGKISFSIYLLHGIMAAVFITILNKTSIIKPGFLMGMAWLAIVIICSFISFKMYEAPSRKFFKSLFNNKQTNVLKPIGRLLDLANNRNLQKPLA